MRGGELLRIPGDGYPFRFVVEPPYGVEQILVAASPAQFEEIEGAFRTLEGKDVVSRGIRLEEANASHDEVLMTITVTR